MPPHTWCRVTSFDPLLERVFDLSPGPITVHSEERIKLSVVTRLLFNKLNKARRSSVPTIRLRFFQGVRIPQSCSLVFDNEQRVNQAA